MLSLRNIAKATGGSLASKIATATTSLFLIRYLSEQHYADFTIIFAVASLIHSAASPALNKIFILAKSDSNTNQPNNFLIPQLSTAIAFVLLLLPVALIDMRLYLLANVLAIAKASADYPRNVSQRKLEFGKVAAIDTLRSFSPLIILLGIITIKTSNGIITPTHATLAFSSGCILTFLVFSHGSNPFDFSRFKHDLVATLRFLKPPHLHIFLYTILLAAYSQVDLFLLKHLQSDLDVATFGTAIKYYGLLTLLAGSINSVYLPTLANLPEHKSLKPFFRKHILVSIPICLGILFSAVAAHIWIPLIDNGKYPDAIKCYQILSASAAISVALNPYSSILLKYRKYGFLLGSTLIALLLTFYFRYHLINSLSAIGASIGTATTITGLNITFFIRSLSLITYENSKQLPSLQQHQ